MPVLWVDDDKREPPADRPTVEDFLAAIGLMLLCFELLWLLPA